VRIVMPLLDRHVEQTMIDEDVAHIDNRAQSIESGGSPARRRPATATGMKRSRSVERLGTFIEWHPGSLQPPLTLPNHL
jgi:hypothetical protein